MTRSPIVIVLGGVLLVACGTDAGLDAPPVPWPSLDRLEPAVRGQIEQARQVLATTAEGEARGRAFGDLGMLYDAYELDGAAAACYANARERLSGDPRWDYYLARVLRRTGRLDDATSAIDRALSRLSGADRVQRVAALSFAGELALERQRLDVARDRFEAGLALDPRCVAALVGLGRVADAEEQFEAAAGFFERAHALAPDAANVEYLLGNAYLALGDAEASRRHLEASATKQRIDLAPADPWTVALRELVSGARRLHQQANLAFRSGQYARAIALYREALAVDPEDASARADLGSALARSGDRAAATAEFEKALKLDRTQLTAQFGLGVLRAGEGRDVEAVEHYRAALELNPAERRARYNLANALSRLRRFDEASDEYAAIVEAEPGNVTARVGLGLALSLSGRYGEALAHLEASHAAIPDNARIRHMLARLLVAGPDADLRDGARGLELARSAVAAEPLLDYVETLAMALAETGRFDDAIRWQRDAIAAVEAASRDERLERLRFNLTSYTRGQPCRVPFHPDEGFATPVQR